MKYLLQARFPAIPPLKPNAPCSKIQSETYRLFGVCLPLVCRGCAVLLDRSMTTEMHGNKLSAAVEKKKSPRSLTGSGASGHVGQPDWGQGVVRLACDTDIRFAKKCHFRNLRIPNLSTCMTAITAPASFPAPAQPIGSNGPASWGAGRGCRGPETKKWGRRGESTGEAGIHHRFPPASLSLLRQMLALAAASFDPLPKGQSMIRRVV
jgi:hypothetical protein